MRIDSSTIGMESARSYKASNMTVRRFMITDYQATLAEDAGEGNAALNTAVNGNQKGSEEQTDQATAEGTSSLTELQNRFSISPTKISLRTKSSNVAEDIRQMTLRYIFDMLFAERRNRLRSRMEENGWSDGSMQSSNSTIGMPGNGQTANLRVLSYTKETLLTEAEETNFSTTGTVRTADGREISFNVNVGMSREFEQYYKEDLQLASFTMCDPLVINLDTDVATLSDQNFYFDIDADGKEDEVARLDGKSGFIALDKNGDGTINDGSELFGTASGNGFADLAKYDEDGNGWIDEGDSVWSKLKIWCKDENGKDILYRLADKGVGAICLQNATTDFTLQAEDGRTKGAVRATGIFLYENGVVGTVQHVDVAKYERLA